MSTSSGGTNCRKRILWDIWCHMSWNPGASNESSWTSAIQKCRIEDMIDLSYFYFGSNLWNFLINNICFMILITIWIIVIRSRFTRLWIWRIGIGLVIIVVIAPFIVHMSIALRISIISIAVAIIRSCTRAVVISIRIQVAILPLVTSMDWTDVFIIRTAISWLSVRILVATRVVLMIWLNVISDRLATDNYLCSASTEGLVDTGPSPVWMI